MQRFREQEVQRNREESLTGTTVFAPPICSEPEVAAYDTTRARSSAKISGRAWGRVRKFLLCKTGFPKCIYFIVGNEFCERFSYYGMKAILFMYLTRVLNLGNNTATAAFHTFSMLCYFTPLFGAMLADGWIGKYRTILYISFVYALGNLTVSLTALPALGMGEIPGPMIGLLLIAIGTGGIKPCVSAFGGDQFSADQEKLLQSFFSVFYFAINAGSLLSMLITPVLRGDVKCFGDDCYALAFGVPAFLMILAIALFWAGRHSYKKTPPTGNIVWQVTKATTRALRQKLANRGTTHSRSHWMDWADDKYSVEFLDDVKAMYRVLFMFLPLPVFWTLFDQQGSRWVQQAGQMDGDIGILGTIKPDQMQALNALFIIVLIPVFEGVIYPLFKKPLPLKRMSMGMLLAAFAFVIAGLVQFRVQAAEVTVVPPRAGKADIELVNTADCTMVASIQNHSVTIQPHKQSIKLSIDAPDNITMSVKTTNCKGKFVKKLKFSVTDKKMYDVILGSKGNQLTGFLVTQNASLPPPGSSRLCIVITALTERIFDVQLGKAALKNLTALKQPRCMVVSAGHYSLDFKERNSSWSLSSNVALGNGGVHVAVLKDSSKNNGSLDIELYKDLEPKTVSMLWQVPQYFVITSGEILFSITGIEFSYSQAPASMKSCLQAAWLVTVALGNLIVVIEAEARVIDKLSTEFFFFAAMLAVVVVVFLVMSRFYKYVERPPATTDDRLQTADNVGIVSMDELSSI